jgi:putative ABC transport system substrate-binding protein
MKRRDLLSLLGGAAASWQGAAWAQKAKPVVGYLSAGSQNLAHPLLAGFHQGLADTGFIEHKNFEIEYRWAEGHYERLPIFAADLVLREVALIAVTGSPAAVAVQAVTKTIPTVFYVGVDPVKLGLVASLARPEGNATGVTSIAVSLVPKRLEALLELLPKASRVALLTNPSSSLPYEDELRPLAKARRVQLQVVKASFNDDLELTFARLQQSRVDGLLVGADPIFNAQSEAIARLALKHAIPTVYQYREFAAAGGLMSYGGSYAAEARLLGSYTGRVLNGERPADLPVQQSSKVELYINLKTAKALGITVPQTLLARADEVIE